jgi:hypothetical protein
MTAGSQAAVIARGLNGAWSVIAGSDRGVAVWAVSGQLASHLDALGIHVEEQLEQVGHALLAQTDLPAAAGLLATSENGPGVSATGSSFGLEASSAGGTGVRAQSHTGTGLDASSSQGIGVRARSEMGVALRVEGRLQVLAPVIGEVSTSGGETALSVHSAAATKVSTIVLTPLGNPEAFLWIDSRDQGTFTIGASHPLPAGLLIQYLIIN